MKKWSFLLIVLVFAVVLTACGGNESGKNNGAASSNTDASQTLAIEASNFKFDHEEYTVKAGEPLKVSLKNTSGYHGIEIEGVGKVDAGKDKVFTLEAGEYVIKCSIMCGTGHNDMVSKLIVQ